MNSNKPWQADHFWQFSLALYERDHVKEACLALQDEGGLNVNVLLLMCYLDRHSIRLSAAQLNQLLAAINVSEVALQQHRSARRSAKGSEGYQSLLAQELQMEGSQQGLLIEQLNQFKSLSKSAQSDDSPSNVWRYAMDHAVCKKALYAPCITTLLTQSRRAFVSNESI